MAQPIFETIYEVPQDAKYSMWSILDSLKKVVEKIISRYAMNGSLWTYTGLLNSWQNYGDPYQGAAYRKDSAEMVHLSGGVKDGTPGATSVVFELPTGCRPSATLRFVVSSDSATDPAHVEINVNGQVIIVAGSATLTSLAGVSFRAETNG